MRTIIQEVHIEYAGVYTFDDGTVVRVCFQPGTPVDANAYWLGGITAQRFLITLDPTSRWEGKIDGAGNALDCPLRLEIS